MMHKAFCPTPLLLFLEAPHTEKTTCKFSVALQQESFVWGFALTAQKQLDALFCLKGH